MYSDVTLHGDQVAAGPYTFINTLAHAGSGGGPAVVLRTEWHLEWDADATRNTTDDSRYVGGDSDDELAALMSLAIGRRIRAGGRTRDWRGGDPLGRPLEFDRQPQVPVEPRYGSVIPSLQQPTNFESATSLLNGYGDLNPTHAVQLARVARLYANGIWVADSDPNTTWLWLVSAVETAATTGTRGEGALKRFRDFLEERAPGPPPTRAPWTQVDWSTLPNLMKAIYNTRSRALHNGKPFPVPMLQAPRMETNEGNEPDGHPQSTGYIERADGIATFSHDAIWSSADIPMLLWVFEYIVREALISWWRDLATP